jgi:hypothetical protein
MKMRRFIFGLFALMLLLGCEKDVDFGIRNVEPVLVVDAEIEQGGAPIVVLTNSLRYFSKLSRQALAQAFIKNADVFVSNGTLTHKLKEYFIPIPTGEVINFYSIDSSNLATAFVGEVNKTYTLRVVTGGKEYTASTKIVPLVYTLDSIWVRPAPNNADSLVRNLYIKSTDPNGLGNSGRYYTQLNNDPFFAGENSVFDDQIVDGTSFSSILPKGVNRNEPLKREENFFKKGDSITVKWCNIDRTTYTFWNTWEFAYQAIGSPFSQPNKVLGNISNGALGAFCGYSVVKKSVKAQ